MEFLARSFTVINLDFRGAGLSERSVASLSLETFAEDLRAVLACLEIDRVALCAMGDAALVACHIASLWPARVSSMAFIGAGESETNRRVLNIRHADPRLEAHMRGALLGGLDDEGNASALSAVAREALNSPSLMLWEKLLVENRLTSVGSRVSVPVLCLHAADDELVPVQEVQSLVKAMSDATLKTVPGRSGMDIWRDRPTVQAMAQFFAKGFGVERNFARAQRRRRQTPVEYPAGLSGREVEVLRFLVAGRTNQQISESLFISLNTVSFHLRNIFSKTGTSNRTEAASFGHRHGISAAIK
jgi:DNA-binding CsgD family transcriptional regulator/pimeloyl-ACP methyl ester carboxylesterase